MLIFVTVIAFNFLGDGLNDAFDPRTVERQQARGMQRISIAPSWSEKRGLKKGTVPFFVTSSAFGPVASPMDAIRRRGSR